jgi:hypothetical protein
MTTDRLLVFGDLPTVSHSVLVMSPIEKKRRPFAAVLAMCGVGAAAGLAFTVAHAHDVAPSTPPQPESEVVVKMPTTAPTPVVPTRQSAPASAKTAAKPPAKPQVKIAAAKKPATIVVASPVPQADEGPASEPAEDETYEITTDPATMHAVRTALEAKGYEIREAELASVPKNLVSVSGATAESLVKLLEELEELDDVQKVAANCDIET